MDQRKTGEFIAQLRRQRLLTQQQLGDILGVTNKTVSRWENGNYMPDIEMLGLLGKTFGVSVEELLAGQRSESDRSAAGELAGEANAPAPEQPAARRDSAFSPEERKRYFIRKWRREHIALFLLLALILTAAIALPFIINERWLVGFVPMLALLGYLWQNNRMMAYVEKNLYDR